MSFDSAMIGVENLGKRYELGQRHGGDGLRHVLEQTLRSPHRWLKARREAKRRAEKEAFWALRDVSFSVSQGEAVAIIGANGAGKSTLLKLLSRITEPTTGCIRYRGRVASLLEVGTGFHPDLTGRENIYLNAAILGMRRSEIQRRFDEIVAFAEVERFLDTPVKRYSNGMYVRLAFGVAAHLEPEILLVDEVLAVGDAAFQQKCLGKMGGVVSEGRTVLFVSHNLAAVRALCSRGLLLEGGRITYSGTPQATIERYLTTVRAGPKTPVAERRDRKGTGRLRFTNVTVLNERDEPVPSVVSGQSIGIALDYRIDDQETLHNAVVQLRVLGELGQPVFVCSSRASEDRPLTLKPRGRLLCRIPKLPLVQGTYPYSLSCTVAGTLEDLVPQAGNLAVVEGDFYGTGILPPKANGDLLVYHRWSASEATSG
jgi:lipopolysaccharide transport system ATP-binding protein